MNKEKIDKQEIKHIATNINNDLSATIEANKLLQIVVCHYNGSGKELCQGIKDILEDKDTAIAKKVSDYINQFVIDHMLCDRDNYNRSKNLINNNFI